MKNKKVFLLTVVLLLAAGIAAYFHWYNSPPSASGRGGITDLSSEYSAEAEIAAAIGKLPQATAATVITDELGAKKRVAITFDGMTDRVTMRKVLDILDKHKLKATFFVEGHSAAVDSATIEAIVKAGQKVGNYTYIGLAKVDQLPQERVIEEFCRTQKVLKITSGAEPKLFKCPQTTYTDNLLKIAQACGLESAVKTNIFVAKDGLGTPEQANSFVVSIKPSSIISFSLSQPVEAKAKSKKKEDDVPAFDKKPTLAKEEKSDGAPPKVDLVDAVDRLCAALVLNKYETDYVENFRKIKFVPKK